MRRIFLISIFTFAACVMFGQQWKEYEMPGDKVEQKPPFTVWEYSDNGFNVTLMSDNKLIVIEPAEMNVRLYDCVERGYNITGTFATIATFDFNDKRVGYWENVLTMTTEDRRSILINEIGQTEERNKGCVYDVWDFITKKSGSVVFRFLGNKQEKIDFEVKTIKTLGYEDKNGRHHDGDVDVLGVR